MQLFAPAIFGLLPALEIFDHFVAKLQQSMPDLACGKGCAICCTDRVTVTEPEAARILMQLPLGELPPAVMEKHVPSPCTTNEFALSCLLGHDHEPADFPENPEECAFLSEAKECTIYPIRPLMCRLFISREPCSERGEASIPDRTFLIQIILQQLAEHLSQGTRWGYLATMLRFCKHAGADAHEGLRICRAIPGFPISSEEKDWLSRQLNPLFDRLISGGWLEDDFSLDYESWNRR